MRIIKAWLGRMFRAEWLNPDDVVVARRQAIHRRVYGSAEGIEQIEFEIETVLLNNPRSTDPYVCVAWAAQCAMIEDKLKALDKAREPGKYPAPEISIMQRKVA